MKKAIPIVALLLLFTGSLFLPSTISSGSAQVTDNSSTTKTISKTLPSQTPSELVMDVKGAGVKDATKVVYEPKIVKVKEIHSFPFTVYVTGATGIYFWNYPSGVQVLDKGDELDIIAAPKGELMVSAKIITADWENKKFITKFVQNKFYIGEVPPGPEPPGPTPPGPGPEPPDPKPPGPTPPGPVKDMHVLIILETSKKSELPKGQLNAIYSKTVRDYLKEKTAYDLRTSDGKAYYIWDQHQNPEGAYHWWAEALARPRTSLPWIVIFGDNKNYYYEGPVPGSAGELLSLLKKFGG